MKTPLAFALVLPVWLLAGCATTSVNTVEPAQTTAQKQMLADKRVITDSTLNRTVRVVGLNSMTGPEGFLKIQLELLNTTKSEQRFTYRIEWFDENGMIIPQPTAGAMPRVIEGKARAYVTATAPTPTAKDFRISLLESDK